MFSLTLSCGVLNPLRGIERVMKYCCYRPSCLAFVMLSRQLLARGDTMGSSMHTLILMPGFGESSPATYMVERNNSTGLSGFTE